MATALIDDLVRTGTGVTTSIRETSTTILTWIGRTAINHLLAMLTLITSLAHTLIMCSITVLTVASIQARKVETMTSLGHWFISTTSELFLMPE